MRGNFSVASLVVSLMGVPLSAASQHVESRPRSASTVEVAATVTAFPPQRIFGVGMRATAGNARRAFEVGIEWTDALNHEHYADQMTWFYFWQMKHSQSFERESSRLFLTYGSAGWVERQRVPPGRLRSTIVPPILPMVGFGWQRTVVNDVSIRIDGQLLIWPFGGLLVMPRVNAGVSIPIWQSP